MDQRAVEVIKEIAEQRQRVGDDIAQFERKVRETVDWRAQFAANPWGMLALALSGGFLLAGLFIPKRR
jgi:hypothetical protein